MSCSAVRRWLGPLLLAVSIPLQAQEIPDSIRIPRLAAIGRLYSAIRFFHPYLGYQGIDWDGAVALAVPAIGLASSREEYRDAVDDLLAVLDDPATRVVDLASPARGGVTGRDSLATRWLADGILLIRLLPTDNADIPGLTARLGDLDSLIRRSQATIIDLRAPEGWQSGGMTDFLLNSSSLPGLLLPMPAVTPSERTRIYEGYPPDSPGEGASFYRSGWHVANGTVIGGGDSVPGRQVIFLVSAWSELPALALATRAAGFGRIIGEGARSRAIGATTGRIPIGDGLAAQVRVGQLISAEGTEVATVDTVVPAATDVLDPALGLALRWSEIPRRSREPSPPALPVNVWPGPASIDPSGYPGTGRRLVGLFRLWGAIGYFHAYPGLYDGDWGALLLQFIPRVERARDSIGYAAAIAELMTHTNDSHGYVRAPGLRALFGIARLPVAARMIEGRAVVTGIQAESVAPGLRAGDEILAVDGEPMRDRLRRLERYISASTEAARQRDALAAALRGDSSVAVLKVRGSDARTRLVRVPRRAAYWDLPQTDRTGPVLRLLPGNIGYADLDRLPGELVDSMFRMFRTTKGIIFDMRGYPKGTAWLIAPRLTGRTRVAAARFTSRIARGPRGAIDLDTDEAIERSFVQYVPTIGGETYPGWTVMLIDERTQSQGEHTGLFFEAANGTRFVGSRSAGADGDVTNVALPGNILVWFTGMAVRHADGRPLQRVGLTPDIPVTPTIRGIRAGRDEVLERAATYLRGLPARRRTP